MGCFTMSAGFKGTWHLGWFSECQDQRPVHLEVSHRHTAFTKDLPKGRQIYLEALHPGLWEGRVVSRSHTTFFYIGAGEGYTRLREGGGTRAKRLKYWSVFPCSQHQIRL